MTHGRHKAPGGPTHGMAIARQQVVTEPGSLITASDLRGTTPLAASRALSRLAREGLVRRARKGLYYVPRKTLLGESSPSEIAILQKVLGRRARPTGITAANLLGMSSQVPARPEFAAYASARPRGIDAARLHLRPRGRAVELEARDAALLEFLRDRGRYGELSAEETCARVRVLLLDGPSRRSERAARLRRLRDAGLAEPPRVRAMLGALMEAAGLPERLWRPLQASLNPLSRFEFGLFG